jgi:hypothetical protein
MPRQLQVDIERSDPSAECLADRSKVLFTLRFRGNLIGIRVVLDDLVIHAFGELISRIVGRWSEVRVKPGRTFAVSVPRAANRIAQPGIELIESLYKPLI